MPSERQIAREALLDAVLGKDFEPWAFAPCSSATEDAHQAAHDEEVLDEDLLRSTIRKLSLTFQGDELSDILRRGSDPPPPLRSSGRSTVMISRVCSWEQETGGGAAMFTRVCSWEQETDELPDARLVWGALAQRYKLAKPASPSRTPSSASSSPCSAADSFVRTRTDVSGAATFARRPAPGQGSFWDLRMDSSSSLLDTLQQHDASSLL